MTLCRPGIAMAVLFILTSLSVASAARADTYQMKIRTDIEKGHADCKLMLGYQNVGQQAH